MSISLQKKAVYKKTLQFFFGIVLCTILSSSLTISGKELPIYSPKNVFVDKSVVAFPKVKGTQTTFQLISHGRPGELLINGEWKNKEKIAQWLLAIGNRQLATKSQKLIANSQKPITHLNIYGCNFAQGTKGLEAVAYLEKTLGISVSASTNITGNGGDWNLEVGQAVATLNLPDYQGNLQNLVNNGSFAGSASGWSLSGASYIGWANHDQMMNLNEGNSNYNGYGQQYINTIAGNTYTLSFNAHNHKTDSYSSDWAQSLVLTIGGNSETISLPAQGSNHGAMSYSRTFTATSSSTLIKFAHGGTNSTEHDILIDDVYVPYIAPPCNAGTTAMTLSTTTKSNNCPATTVDLSGIVTSSCPVGSSLEWHTTNTGFSSGNLVSNPTSVSAGTYYPVCHDITNNCYNPAPAIGVTASINTCTVTQSCAVNIIQNPSFETYATCPPVGTNTLQDNASFWTSVGTTELMVVNSTCNANNPCTCNTWSTASLTGGHNSAAWIGFHGGERAINALSCTLQPGTYTITFWGGYAVDNSGIYTTGAPVGVYTTAGTLLGSSATLTNRLSPTNQTWQQYSITFTTTTALTQLAFGAAGSGYLYVDDFTLLSTSCAAPLSLTATSKSNVCPVATVDISNLAVNTCPTGYTLEWHTQNTFLSAANKLANPTAAPAGTYYATCYNATGNCYGQTSTSAVTVTTTSCCSAGTTAMTLSATSATNVCPTTTVNLTNFVTSTCPVGSLLEWHTSNIPTASNKVSTPTAVSAGTYYPVCFDATKNCYNPAPNQGLTVTLTGPCCTVSNLTPIIFKN